MVGKYHDLSNGIVNLSWIQKGAISWSSDEGRRLKIEQWRDSNPGPIKKGKNNNEGGRNIKFLRHFQKIDPFKEKPKKEELRHLTKKDFDYLIVLNHSSKPGGAFQEVSLFAVLSTHFDDEKTYFTSMKKKLFIIINNNTFIDSLVFFVHKISIFFLLTIFFRWIPIEDVDNCAIVVVACCKIKNMKFKLFFSSKTSIFPLTQNEPWRSRRTNSSSK